MVKKGDTLIEVTIAVGIFSMIAIVIANVMSNGVASAQTALEATLAREEIDNQAEALRFIQSSYIADINNPNNKYKKLWEKIAGYATELRQENEQVKILQYSPETCEELYNNSSPTKFIINTRKLNEPENVDDVLINYGTKKLKPAATYPRLIYGTDNKTESSYLDRLDSLYGVEGIYIIAVKEKTSSGQDGLYKGASTFYDFYIRTCWYGNKSSDTSTISTVMRLYDPKVVTAN